MGPAADISHIAAAPSIVLDDLSTRRNTNEAAMSSTRLVRNAAVLLDGSLPRLCHTTWTHCGRSPGIALC